MSASIDADVRGGRASAGSFNSRGVGKYSLQYPSSGASLARTSSITSVVQCPSFSARRAFQSTLFTWSARMTPVVPLAGGNGNFEWVPFRLIRDGACQRQAGFRVVYSRCQHQCRAPPRLLAAGLRVERQPDKITGLRYKGGPHQDSSP
jgi:hypothetical protein